MAVSKPTVDDLIGWLKLQTSPSDETYAVYTEAFDAALDDVESRINLPAGTTDGNYPQRVRTAILIAAARLAKRSTTPEGAGGFGTESFTFTIGGRDPDVEQLIRRFLKLDGFY